MRVWYGAGPAQYNINELGSGNMRIGMARSSGTSLVEPTGNHIQAHSYLSDTFLVLQSVEKYTDNDFYFAGGYRLDSCNTIDNVTYPYTHPVIGHMDSLGTVVSARQYRLNTDQCGNGANHIEVLNDGGAVAWGHFFGRFFALRVDVEGGVVWARRFPANGVFRFIKELPDGDLLAGFDMDIAGASVVRFDTAGNIVWCKSYLRPVGHMHDAVLTEDGSLIITGITSDQADKLFIMKLSVGGDVLWCRGYGGSNPWDLENRSHIVPTRDGQYAVLATIGQNEFLQFYRPLLIKLDGNGDTLWTRSHGLADFVYEAKSLHHHSDGGYIFNGLIWGPLPDNLIAASFLYKTDSLGYLSCDNHQYPLQIVDLFPTDSSFTLTSTDGATALPAFIEDQTYPPITQYDGCTLQPTRVPTISKRPPNMSVRPNPNTGRFTMAFNDPLIAESWYSVYDATGKLLYQRRLNPGQGTEEVDLSRYGKGTYLIKCTDKEGVYHERVVVE